ncbi:uncharacterized protein SPPG_00519 [Spizellomyces punctatus DAOM BR117]|uniref:NADH-cytochrome b5 reductase n=1 Tax=Spizellomyces punctatus (strain DAOM BR117) TaxID=645134 RepID=A0A0L0HTZ1_SPIPD|nr:uncharacterized protein SPPG_00519 [Spizellomyces punctatus DAOM BR117]KND04816.1 hypothetical protein SPPG_00519 [Spizellomyces punctatus DAOM BR117]|eukprot:XP_016612855.1 hypothetical protein SPPG_00519 [Spizellomyces punctatus DAOM BR117]
MLASWSRKLWPTCANVLKAEKSGWKSNARSTAYRPLSTKLLESKLPKTYCRIPQTRSAAASPLRSSSFPRIISKRFFQATTLKPAKLEPHHQKLIFIVVVVGTVVIGFDIYYFAYVHEPTPSTLTPEDFRPFKLVEKVPLTHDTSLLRFAAHLPQADSPAGIPVPSHVIVKDDTCQIARAYTPVTYVRGHFDLLVKEYENGSVSRFLHGVKLGDKVEIRGPIITLPYEANAVDEIGMIAGGTGITPIYQLIKRILKDPTDKTRISLIYANRSEEDILLRNELEILSSSRPDQLQIYYIVENPPAQEGRPWAQGVGLVSQDMITKHLPNPDKGMKAAILVCGPDGLINHVAGPKASDDEQGPLGGLLKKLGYQDRQVFKF